MSGDHLLELLFTQSLDGFFFMMLDEPIEWNDQADKEQLLDYAFEHQRVVLVNDAMLNQYRRVPRGVPGPPAVRLLRARPGARPGRLARDVRSRPPPRQDARAPRGWYADRHRGRLHLPVRRRPADHRPLRHPARRHRTGAPANRQWPSTPPSSKPKWPTRTADLRRSENRVRAIVNALPDLLFVIDQDGRYVEIVTENPRLLFRDAHDMLGRTFGEVLPAAGRGAAARHGPEDGGDRQATRPSSTRSTSSRAPCGSRAARRCCDPSRGRRRTSSSSPATSPTASGPTSWKARTSTCRRPSTPTCTSARSWAAPRRCSRCSGPLRWSPTPIRRCWCWARPAPARS